MLAGNYAQFISADILHVGRLNQKTATNAFVVKIVRSSGQRHLEDANILFFREDLARTLVDLRRDDDFDELLADSLCRLRVDSPVKSNDAAERGSGIGRQCLFVCSKCRRVHTDAARIGVLDDDAGGLVKGFDTFPGCIRVSNVVVGQFLALQLSVVRNAPGCWRKIAVEGRFLMRIFSIPQVLDVDEIDVRLFRESLSLAVHVGCREVIADRRVVGGGMGERTSGETKTRFLTDGPTGCLDFLNQRWIVRRVRDDGDVLPVLGSGPHHGRSADVDILDRILQCAIRFGDRLHKGVEIDDDNVDGRDSMFFQRLQMRVDIASREDAAMHFRMQRLDPAIKHFRETGVFADLGYVEAGFLQHLRCSSSG